MPRATFILPTYHIEFGGTFKPYHLDQEIEYENSERYKREQSKINKVPSYEEYWSLPEFLPDTYETPETVERITANILHYLLKSTYLDTVNRARTYSYANHRFGERESAGNVCIETDQQGLKFSIGDGSVNVYASRRIASAEEIIHIRANREFRINELKEKEAERFIHSDN